IFEVAERLGDERPSLACSTVFSGGAVRAQGAIGIRRTVVLARRPTHLKETSQEGWGRQCQQQPSQCRGRNRNSPTRGFRNDCWSSNGAKPPLRAIGSAAVSSTCLAGGSRMGGSLKLRFDDVDNNAICSSMAATA